MSETEPDESANHHASARGARIVDWLNSLDASQLPGRIQKHGNITLAEFQQMPEHLRERIIGAFGSRRDHGNDPFPGGGGQNPGASGPGGPGNHPGGGNPHPGGNGPEKRDNPGGPELRQELAAEYGWSMAFLNHHPELKRLFNQAVKDTWTPERFVAELRDTKWFQNHSASVRQFQVNRITDPASWQADLDKTEAHIRQSYGQLVGMPLGQGVAQKWAMRAMKFGWTEEQINDHLVSSINFTKKLRKNALGGTAVQTANQIRAIAADYGVGTSDKWTGGQIEAVLKGNETMDGVMNSLKERAKNKYDAFADQLDAGKTMADIADPYRQSYAQLLELNPGQVKITNNDITKALTRRVDGKSHPLSLGDFEDSVRKDPRWMRTQQANDQFEQVAYQALTSWGLI